MSCIISNTGGSLTFKAITWNEDQIFHPSIRPIPNISSPYIDLSQYMIEVRAIDFTARFTDAEYATLMAIYNASTQVTTLLYNNLLGGYWTYTGYLEQPDAKFEYKMESGENIRWWIVTLTIRCDSITGAIPTQFIFNGGFELDSGGNHNIGWINSTATTDQAHSGSWSSFLYESEMYQATPFAPYNVPVSAITTFGFWWYGSGGDATFSVEYSDTIYPYEYIWIPIPNNGNVWTYMDIIPHLIAGKIVNNIHIHGGTGAPIYIDDITLINSGFGLLSDSYANVQLGAGILDPTGIYLGFVIDFERTVTSTVWMPQWMNQPPAIDYLFHVNSPTVFTYEARCSDADKWYLDQLFLNLGRLQLFDRINNVYSSVIIEELEAEYTSDNWERPWILTLIIYADNVLPIPFVDVTISSTDGSGGEKIQNGDFETGSFAYWNAYYGPTVVAGGHSGYWCVEFPISVPFVNTPFIEQNITPFESYNTSMTLWIMGDLTGGGGGDSCAMAVFTDSGSYIHNIPNINYTSWTQITFLVPNGKTITSVEVWIGCFNIIYIDDVSLIYTPPSENTGTIRINETNYVMTGVPLVIPLFGFYNPISFTPVSGDFVSWTPSGGVSVGNPSINPTTLGVTTSGSLVITFS